MNKREEAKKNSRAKIIDVSLHLFIENGLSKTTTAMIAKKAGISHGNIFAHFKNRDALISEVLEAEVKRLTLEIDTDSVDTEKIDTLLDQYISVISSNEGFFSCIYNELPFLSEKIQKNIIALEAVMRNKLYFAIKASNQVYKSDDYSIKVGLHAFFATIENYIRNRMLFTSQDSVLIDRKHEIIYIFKQLFRRN